MNLLQSLSPFQILQSVENKARSVLLDRQTVTARINTVNNRDKILTLSVSSFGELKQRLERYLDCTDVRIFHCNGSVFIFYDFSFTFDKGYAR